MKRIFLFCSLFSLFITCASAWDDEDLQLFDLVEEVNKNFYEILGLSSSASLSDIRRAYRKLSLQLHPDKNKNDNAEEEFRQLTAVAEVLRNEKLRERYDDVLRNGLPDWRQPIYYYRKVRKLGLLELSLLLTLIITVGQYLVAWSAYLEKKFERELFLQKRRRKKEKRDKKRAVEDLSEMVPSQDLLPTPKLSDLLPCRLCLFLFNFTRQLPENLLLAKDNLSLQLRDRLLAPPAPAKEEDDTPTNQVELPRKRKQAVEGVRVDSEWKEVVAAKNAGNSRVPSTVETATSQGKLQCGAWCEEDNSQLARLMVRYPGGTPQRWDIISEEMGRPLGQVTKRVKEMRVSMHGGAPAQGLVTKQRAPPLPDSLATEGAVSGVKGQVMVAASLEWTQPQQDRLQSALHLFPKGTENRWDRITEHIHGKSKEECVARYKEIVEAIRKKKQS